MPFNVSSALQQPTFDGPPRNCENSESYQFQLPPLPVRSIGIEIPTPAADEYYVLMHFPAGQGGELKRLFGKTPASSGDTCGARLYKRDEFNYDVSAGQVELTSSALSLDDNGAEVSTFAVNVIAEKQVLVVKIDAISGSPDWVWIQIEYQET